MKGGQRGPGMALVDDARFSVSQRRRATFSYARPICPATSFATVPTLCPVPCLDLHFISLPPTSPRSLPSSAIICHPLIYCHPLKHIHLDHHKASLHQKALCVVVCRRKRSKRLEENDTYTAQESSIRQQISHYPTVCTW
jgi:hypothetical protein